MVVHQPLLLLRFSCACDAACVPDLGVSQRPLGILVTGEPVAGARRLRGSFEEMIQRTTGDAWSGAWSVLPAQSLTSWPEPEDLAGLVITGSAAFLRENSPWMQQSLLYLSRLVAARIPILGICFGHQMLGQALGGRVDRNPLGREIGTERVRFVDANSRAVFGEPEHALPASFLAHTTHLDSVVELPEGARVLATTERDPAAFVEFGANIWGVQFHPEMDEVAMGAYIEDRAATLRSEGRDVEQLLSAVEATPVSHGLLKAFAHFCASNAL
jgi:GMP synthase (glutamine-hydrolysing)